MNTAIQPQTPTNNTTNCTVTINRDSGNIEVFRARIVQHFGTHVRVVANMIDEVFAIQSRRVNVSID